MKGKKRKEEKEEKEKEKKEKEKGKEKGEKYLLQILDHVLNNSQLHIDHFDP